MTWGQLLLNNNIYAHSYILFGLSLGAHWSYGIYQGYLFEPTFQGGSIVKNIKIDHGAIVQ